VKRQSYDGVVLAAPVSVPYVRYSQETAHWWIARALKKALDLAGLSPRELDGFSVSSFTLFPDTPVGLTQHLGLSPRWLDSIPMGGASGVVALRRAARAVQAGDVDVVACVAGDANRIDSFRQLLSSFSRFAMDASYPYGSGGPNASFALIADAYMAEYGVRREDFGRIAVAQRTNALAYPNAIMKSPLTLEQYLSARPISEPFGLFDCVMPCAGAEGFLVMREEEAQSRGLPYARIRPRSSATTPFPTIRSSCAAAGRWISMSSTRWPAAGPKTSTCCRPMTTTR
jgi:acetyl-CoA acetyltransferase